MMKAIEVQLAVHRAPETSRMQHEQLQRPLTDQMQIAERANVELERTRHRSAPTAEAADTKVRKDGHGAASHESGSDDSREREEAEAGFAAAPHPFKGKHLDLSL